MDPIEKSPYLKLIEASEQDLDALPHSQAFEQVMLEHMSERKTIFQLEQDFDLNTSLLPHELMEAFYLPTSARVSDIKAILDETVLQGEATDADVMAGDSTEHLWYLTLQFTINGATYLLTSNKVQTILQTDSLQGGVLQYEFKADLVTSQLLAAFITSCIAPSTETQDEIFTDYIYGANGTGYKEQLLALGHLAGSALTSITAELPYEWGDRAIIASYSQMESMVASGVSTGIDLAWELFDTSTELSLTSHAIKDKVMAKAFTTTYAEVSNLPTPIESFITQKQMDDMFATDNLNLAPPLTIDRANPRWMNIAVTFMATIGPLLDGYKDLSPEDYEEVVVTDTADDLDEDSFDTSDTGA